MTLALWALIGYETYHRKMVMDDPFRREKEALAHAEAENAAKWDWRRALLAEQQRTNDLLAKVLEALGHSSNDRG
jgi:hypothetical protein